MQVSIVEGRMLRWARSRAGFNIDQVASHMDKPIDLVRHWEDGTKPIFMGQLRKLAKFYDVAISDFYLPEPPSENRLSRNFRRFFDSIHTDRSISTDLRKHFNYSNQIQTIVKYLQKNSSNTEPIFRTKISESDDPEKVGLFVRNLIGLSSNDQFEWDPNYQTFNELRAKIEALNILVSQFEKVSEEEISGYSIHDNSLPLISVNRKLAIRARSFTLMHELAHILLGDGGVFVLEKLPRYGTKDYKTEAFCNHVAAASLMPKTVFLSTRTVQVHGEDNNWHDNEIKQIANRFGTSEESAVRRLLTFGLTTRTFYNIKRDEYRVRREKFLEERAIAANLDTKPYIPASKLKRSIHVLGLLTTRVICNAYSNGNITLAEASDYLGVLPHDVRNIENEIF